MLEETAEMIADLRSLCVQCGRCNKVCPSFRHGGCNPKQVMAGDDASVTLCIGCGKCSVACPRTNPKKVMMALKAEAKGASPPPFYKDCGYIVKEPDPAVYGDIPDVEDGDDVYIMPGCIAKRKVPFVLYASRKALIHIGVGNSELPGNSCCTYPVVFKLRPKKDNEADMRRLGAAAAGKETISICGGCRQELLAQDIDFPHISEYLAHNIDRIRSLPGVRLRIALEPGCSCERLYPEMKAVAEACGCEVVNGSYGCCGKAVPDVQKRLMDEREAECGGADAVVVGCPNCLSFYDSYPGGIPVLHLSELVCLAAGDGSSLKYHKLKPGDLRWGIPCSSSNP